MRDAGELCTARDGMNITCNSAVFPSNGALASKADYSNAFFDDLDRKTLASARTIAHRIVEWFKPERVIDVGCGRGVWLAAFQEVGVPHVAGVDGPWVQPDKLHIDSILFIERDLGSAWQLDGHFDIALCLEVAEHLPQQSSAHLVDQLTALAPIVVFSAAIPGQGGTGHINEQWPPYWQALFAGNGFIRVDAIRPLVWRDPNVAWFYQQNIYLYVANKVLVECEWLNQYADAPGTQELTLVHPKILSQYMSVWGALSVLPKLVQQSLQRRMARK
jgi:hypothetical protein